MPIPSEAGMRQYKFTRTVIIKFFANDLPTIAAISWLSLIFYNFFHPGHFAYIGLLFFYSLAVFEWIKILCTLYVALVTFNT